MGTSAWSRQLAEKLTGIVRGFADGNGALTLTQIATAAGVPLSTAERLAAGFTSWGLLTLDSAGRYRPGLLIGLHLQSAERTDENADVLATLVKNGDRTARLGAAHSTGVAYLERQPDTRSAAFSSVGTVSQLDSALGQALLARDAAGVPTGGAAGNGAHHGSAERSLALTRLTGVAVVRYREAVTGVAIPVYRPDGTPVVALELIVRGRPDVEGAIEELTATARTLADRLPEPAESLHTRAFENN